MQRIQIKACAKINLSLDVLRRLENRYHEVEMVMQQILLHDDVAVRWFAGEHGQNAQKEKVEIELSTNRPYLPRDERNLAYKAAMVMTDRYGGGRSGKIRIDIKKRIPVAAGLAGGSSNGAAVIHALNYLWQLGLGVKELCEVGSELGSDVPFSIMGQAKENTELGLAGDPLATHCAVARGTGTDLEPVIGLKSHLVLTKPPMGVSTAEVYQGLEIGKIERHPNTRELVTALAKKNYKIIQKNMINVLENFTLTRYPNVMYTKNKVERLFDEEAVLMSGSGPTIFALCRNRSEAQRACEELKTYNKETFWTRTTY
ncbi:4-(cytidine 5'-diphospho)-2-C-methyl-D-erythritol kinase [Anaerovorax odorimutans]|uniref:4-diphosphocytidyl-2-C-methyl-D-erythritol kinase n=1 Tax=Anaerovorax odorimutans TaxID=109327 RepID=A0ABT1RN40_9FIRM|nr:4-(cytidine 5'-diphospho)-2-C-methyl-D-erythritol kinase [Anaerovorax odorimutans]MCQ4636607.1 4-(cytidine 5'-diphospho)-2-C-methyl-D-erythritol kinase [Anaerovorax odorimutans]